MQYPAHGGGSGQKRANREDDNPVTEFAQSAEADRRRLATFRPVKEQRHAGKRPDSLRRLRLGDHSLNEQDVGAGGAVQACTFYRPLEALDGAGVGSGDDDEVGTGPRLALSAPSRP